MTDQERRRYFRIDDSMRVAYQLIGAEEAKALHQKLGGHSLLDMVSQFDNRIHTLLDACRVQNPVAAELLELMNRKLNTVVHQLGLDSEVVQQMAFEQRQVNLSACGMAFALEPDETAIAQGQLMRLELSIGNNGLTIPIVARVIAVQQEEITSETGDRLTRDFVRVNFEDINQDDQELLIQHIVKRQVQQLKIR